MNIIAALQSPAPVNGFFRYVSLILALSFIGCGSSSDDPSSDGPSAMGAATVFIRWHSSPSSSSAFHLPVTIAAISDCQSEGILEIVCSGYSVADAFLFEGGPWPCVNHGIILEEIPTGPERLLVCMGMDANESISHLGHVSGMTIRPNQTTDAGIIDAYPFVTVPSTPVNGARVTANWFSLNWHSVPNAHHYRIQVSETPDFGRFIIDDITTQTNFVPSVLLPDTAYHWRIIPQDRFGHMGHASQVRQFLTLPGAVCRAPRLTPIGNQIVPEGGRLSFGVTAADPDSGDRLTVTSSPLPNGAVFDDAAGQFVWQTRSGDRGNYAVTFTVCDSCSEGPLCDSEEVNLSVGDVCRPPVLDSIGPRLAMPGTLLNFSLNAEDPDSHGQLSFRATNLPPGAIFNPATRTFAWTPQMGTAGNYNVHFEVCDNCNEGTLCDAEQVTITVGNTCQPPVLTSIGARQIMTGETLSLTLSATDPDPDSQLRYQATNLPPGALFDTASRTFTWTPQGGDIGNYSVQFEVCDDCNDGPLCDAEEVDITVGGSVCRPPVLDPIGDQSVPFGDTLDLRVDASDPDTNSVLNFSALGPGNDPSLFDPHTQRFQWRPTFYEEIGLSHSAIFQVCDNCPDGPLCDTEEISITVYLTANSIAGEWVPVDSSQAGVLQSLSITPVSSTSDRVSLHAFGDCQAVECDLGSVESSLDTTHIIEAAYPHPWGTFRLRIEFTADLTASWSYLQVQEQVDYTEEDGRTDMEHTYRLGRTP